jgi:hypothetical protein
MKRLYIVDCDDEDLYYKFINNIKSKIPNIVVFNYFKDIVYEMFKMPIDRPYTNNSLLLHLYLSKFEAIARKYFKYSLINQVNKSISYRDTPRTIMFILIKDRIQIHYIRKQFKDVNVQIIKIKTNASTFREYSFEPIKKYDRVIQILEDNDNLLELVSKTFMTDIPVKWFINNK